MTGTKLKRPTSTDKPPCNNTLINLFV